MPSRFSLDSTLPYRSASRLRVSRSLRVCGIWVATPSGEKSSSERKLSSALMTESSLPEILSSTATFTVGAMRAISGSTPSGSTSTNCRWA